MRFIQNKRNNIDDLQDRNEPDFFAVTEHALFQNEINTVKYGNYVLSSATCRDSEHRGGGVAIYVKDSFSCKSIDSAKQLSQKDICEITAIQLEIEGTDTAIAGVYRKPHTNIDRFFGSLEELLAIGTKNGKHLILAGDFNINLQDPSVLKFIELTESYSMKPSFTTPTRVKQTTSTCIDDIFTDTRIYCTQKNNFDPYISDHKAQFAKVRIDIKKQHDTIEIEQHDICDANIHNSKSKI